MNTQITDLPAPSPAADGTTAGSITTTGTTVLYLSHGGGPMPLLGDAAHREMVECLQGMARRLPRPEAIVVISAHWEESFATLTSAAQPELLYDYYGFPSESYDIRYPCPGHPQLAQQLHQTLQDAGIEARQTSERGLDHGVFVPLRIMYPQADIPCVQLSLLSNLDALAHVKLGQALRSAPLTNVLVIGSGFSFHNMRAFFAPESPDMRELNESFEAWLLETCGQPGLDAQERLRRLEHWEQAPGALFCHPRAEHLLPLHVCAGLSGGACAETFELRIMDKKSSMYLWYTAGPD
ncbi:MAG TPA: dioxygenase [Pseudomonadaceae bacterium]|nr:dioxygenase [Pseudomonadaceae bacterium]